MCRTFRTRAVFCSLISMVSVGMEKVGTLLVLTLKRGWVWLRAGMEKSHDVENFGRLVDWLS
jgi:hypothetical protein